MDRTAEGVNASGGIGVGVIGVGLLGERHARVWSEIPGAHLVAVADASS